MPHPRLSRLTRRLAIAALVALPAAGAAHALAPDGERSPVERPVAAQSMAEQPLAQQAYHEEERCQPMDDMDDPSDGVVPSPEELLPDPEECPEFYEGDGSGQAAPPVSGLPELPSDPPSGEPVVPEYDPCSETASLNGFPCTSTPEGPIYITPDPSYPD